MSERLYKYYLTFICSKFGTMDYFDCTVTLTHKLTEKIIDDTKEEFRVEHRYKKIVLLNAILLEE